MPTTTRSYLRLSRNLDVSDGITVHSKPSGADGTPYEYRDIGYGFQLLDGVEDREAGFLGMGELAITVLFSYGQHGRSEIIVVYSACDGEMRVVNKGSIAFRNDEDLRWIEKIVNGLFDEWEASRAKSQAALDEIRMESHLEKVLGRPVTKLNQVPDDKWAEMAGLVRVDPVRALKSIIAVLEGKQE